MASTSAPAPSIPTTSIAATTAVSASGLAILAGRHHLIERRLQFLAGRSKILQQFHLAVEVNQESLIPVLAQHLI